MSKEVQLRITLLGDGAVGKTSLRKNFLGEGFSSEYSNTLGADFALFRQEIGEYTAVYQIWDLAGQKAYQEIRSRFYKGTRGGILVFDLTRPETLTNISNWFNELYKNNGKGAVPVILVGNKSDLKERAVTREEAENYANSLSDKILGFEVKYLETSAKNGSNVKEAFRSIGNIIMNDILE